MRDKRGDASFLPFVAPTLDIVLHALGRLEDVRELASLDPLVRATRDATPMPYANQGGSARA
jgi:hypothetical protein